MSMEAGIYVILHEYRRVLFMGKILQAIMQLSFFFNLLLGYRTEKCIYHFYFLV